MPDTIAGTWGMELLFAADCPGVCGGVKSGILGFPRPDPAAAIDGSGVNDGVGLFMIGGAF